MFTKLINKQPETCGDMGWNCCDCGGGGDGNGGTCGCAYCWSCHACDACLNGDDNVQCELTN